MLEHVPVKKNLKTAAYEDIPDNCSLPPSWQEFGEEAQMGVMVMCAQNFADGAYLLSKNFQRQILILMFLRKKLIMPKLVTVTNCDKV